ncbi:unnamed protein product [Clavelina lepadiformis]|uniref:Catenin delta-2 n=1 Tax=Clavelina lepadiformis TaxID=159417 RepID=A0ABP0F6K6_CLALP
MSCDKRKQPFTRQADTELILASVKEQEIQFEKLTRELEEEHNTVANQLERCRIKTNLNEVDEEQAEASDTESRRDSSNDADQKLIRQSSASSHPDLYKMSDTLFRRSVSPQKAISAKMDRPQTCPIVSTENHTNYSSEQFKPLAGLAHPQPYYAGPPLSTWMPEYPANSVQIVQPVHYHPAYHQYPVMFGQHIDGVLRQADYTAKAPVQSRNSSFENNQPPPYESHVQDYPHLYGNSPYQGQYYLHQPSQQKFQQAYFVCNQPYTNYPPKNQYKPVSHRAPPVPSKPKPPPPPPRKSSSLQNHLPDVPQYQPNPVHQNNHTADEVQRIPQSTPVRRRQHSTDSHRAFRNSLIYSERQPNQHWPSSQPQKYLDLPSAHYGDLHPQIHRKNILSASPRTVNPAHLHPVLYDEFSRDRDLEISEVIQMLRHPSYTIVSNAAAYIQHVTYGDDNMKSVIRNRGVLPLLVNLLHHHVIDVQQNACGALRNMVYGKNNDDAKIIVRNCGGISSLAHVLRNTVNQEMKELITGVLWNLSSCEHLKVGIVDSAMPVLASRVVIHYVSLLEPNRMAKFCTEDGDSVTELTASDLTIDPHWSTLFINATGCLRNISSAGVEVRRKMRLYEGLIESLLLVIENVIGKNDVDSKGVENCMCILRNLSYRLALEVEAAHVPLSRNADSEHKSKEEDCWRKGKKKGKRRSNDIEVLLNATPSRSTSQGSIHGVELLWQPGVVRRYLALLAETCNHGTLEAASGALQNLSAGQWVWSANIRTAVRKEKGLPMLVEFLQMNNERIVTVMCSTLRNMALDERNKQLIGKHALSDFVDLLPGIDHWSHGDSHGLPPLQELPPVISGQKVLLYEAVCSALRELISSNTENATALYNIGAVPKLIDISRGSNYRYPHRIVKAAGKVLMILWEYKCLRTLLKQRGWSQYHFHLAGVPSIASVGSQVSPFSSPPLSPNEQNSPRDAHSVHNYKHGLFPQSSNHHNMHSSSSVPSPYLPYVAMSTTQPNANVTYSSPQPDANYVMMIKHESEGLPVDSWV